MRNFPKCTPDNLPAELRQKARFCLWKYETVDGRENCKVPYNPNTGGRAQANNPDTFASLRDAAANGAGYDGIGVGIFGNLAAIDIDHCIDSSGQLSPMAADVMQMMDCYTERSPSGEGLRIFFYADLQTSKDEYEKQYMIKDSKKGLEIYIAGMTSRYVTATGDIINSAAITDRTAQVMQVLDKYMKRPQQTQQPRPAPSVELSLSDAELIDKAKAARNGGTFTALWEGDLCGNKSHSEADQALCNLLAFWTAGDTERIDRLFRQSGLMREKWENREKYRQQTIAKAVESCKEFYTPRAPQNSPETDLRPQGSNSAPDMEKPQESPQEATEQPKRSPVELFDLFIDKIQTDAYKPIKTGMPALDTLLGGGLDPQSLVMIGAAPGMGKTSLTQQIFETMAANGTDIIFLNLEMSREQLLARSISRAIARKGGKVTAANVMRGYAWEDTQRRFVLEAAAAYRRDIAPRMQYNPDGTSPTIPGITATLSAALEAAQAAGKPAPLVVLDYLQLVQAEQKQDPQEAIKQAVKALKDYAIAGNTVSCAILAFNRQSNASGKVTLESGRDTSAIEYSADTLIGINYAALEDGTKSISQLDELQQEKPRRLVLKLLKKRMTDAGGKVELFFDGASSTFSPIETRYTEPGGFVELHGRDAENPFEQQRI
jgi:replicative DNA helicase